MTSSELPLEISPIALLEIEKIINDKKLDKDFSLRIGIKGSGCAGTSYLIGFDKMKPDDKVFQLGDISILIQKKHFMYVSGIKIDFVENNQQRGFTFENVL